MASIRSLILDFVWYLEGHGTGIFPSLLQLLPNLQRLFIHLARSNVSIFNASSFASVPSITSVRTLILDKIVFGTVSQLYSLLSSFNNLELITNMNVIRINDANATTLDGPILETLLFPQCTVSTAKLRVLSIFSAQLLFGGVDTAPPGHRMVWISPRRFMAPEPTSQHPHQPLL
ncbi:uncharacterized protein ARMOST_12147 [Armillaria ostoyae]|uniref:Uncharacterized protein n=1 Tax=Armillaria ostoyae TaxID=47428 RepID=A0A284RJ91_ARMOS|nr:uncharacterized protein ARMOST_12147 [Armillaria ostoyae]